MVTLFTLKIDNIDTFNNHSLYQIASDAGYYGSVVVEDFTKAYIDLGIKDLEREIDTLIDERVLMMMIGQLVMAGMSVILTSVEVNL